MSPTSRRPGLTPLAAVASGIAAGVAGTLAMDLLLFARYRRDGGEDRFVPWETSAGLEDWEQAPAPAQVGRRLVEGLFRHELPPARARLTNNVTHWAYGVQASVAYGIVAGSLARPRIRFGVPFGAGVWAAGYVVLPAAGLYEPIWRYDARTLAKDLSAHLVYGVSTAAAFKALARAQGA